MLMICQCVCVAIVRAHPQYLRWPRGSTHVPLIDVATANCERGKSNSNRSNAVDTKQERDRKKLRNAFVHKAKEYTISVFVVSLICCKIEAGARER